MLKSYLFIALRHIKHNKIYSLLNISGLAVGLSAFNLIGLYVQYELSFDKYHENADRIYRVVRDEKAFTPAALAPALKEEFPEVEAFTRIIQENNILLSYGENHFLEETIHWAGPQTFKIFTLPFIAGDPETALHNPNSIVLSQKTAEKYFGNEDPLGKIIILNDRTSFTVTGIFTEMPANSHFVMEIVLPYADWFRLNGIDITQWGGNFSYTFILLQEGADPTLLEEKIQPIIAVPMLEMFGRIKPYMQEFFLRPITDIHLYSHRMQEISMNNDIKTILIFSTLAFLILFIACINYMNLATARSIRRSKEIGMRKVVGAQRNHLVYQFLGESVTMTVLAFILSLIVTSLVLPTFNNLVEKPLTFDSVSNPHYFIGFVMLVIFVGLFSGSYPALLVSGYKPIAVLRGAFTRTAKGMMLRNLLVLFQFSITILLFICTLTIQEQLAFIQNMDVGYRKEQIITMDIRDSAVLQNIELIKEELSRHPDIKLVSTSARLPNDIDTFMSRYLNSNKPDDLITIFYNTVDYDFIDLYDIPIVEGRNFSREFISDQNGVFLVNEAAVRAAEWDYPVGRNFTHWNGKTGIIVGVMKDFNLHSLHSPIDPLYLFLNPSSVSQLSIRISPMHIPSTLTYVKDVMKKFSSNYPFEYSFFDDIFNRAYHMEQRIVNIFRSFAVLAIMIACLGLLGLTAFTAEQRTREIGIRKVVGAPIPRIVLLLSKELMRWLILANLIAWPLAYFTMNKWLEKFIYRIDLHLLLFVSGSLLALSVAGVTIALQASRAAFTNPVEALKYE